MRFNFIKTFCSFHKKGPSVPGVASISGHRTPSQLFRYAHAELNLIKSILSNISTLINNDLMEEKGRRIFGGYYWIKQEDYKPSKITKRYKKNIHNARKN